MGATLSPSRRIFNVRNSFARTVLFAIVILFLVAGMIRLDSTNVRSTVMKAAASAKYSISYIQEQRPIETSNGPVPHGLDGDAIPADIHTTYNMTMNCSYDKDHLQSLQMRYSLGDEFEYVKRYVKISREDVPRKSVTIIGQRLLPKVSPYRSSMTAGKEPKNVCAEPLTVPVTTSPYPDSANLSDFIFGVSTTYERFAESQTSPIREWSYWLTDSRGNSNGGKLVVLLLDASREQLRDAQDRLSQVGIDADVVPSDPSLVMAVRYLTIVPTLYNHRDRLGRKWVVTCDDDTFFPSPNALVEKFRAFDAGSPMYIGTLSEDANALGRHGSQAFGGAGVFLSVPMAEMITSKYTSCKTDKKVEESNTGWGPQGDILLRKCIYENSDVRLTNVWDLWQLDLFGDPSGFYESGIKPLSLHHYRGGLWHVAYPFQYTKLAHLCGEDCTLQRFRTEDDFVISTGFSIVHYPRGIDFDLNQMERTFRPAPDDKGWNLDFKLGPQRKSLQQTGKKTAWDLQESSVSPDGSVNQVYIRKAQDERWKKTNGEPMSRANSVIELVWIS